MRGDHLERGRPGRQASLAAPIRHQSALKKDSNPLPGSTDAVPLPESKFLSVIRMLFVQNEESVQAAAVRQVHVEESHIDLILFELLKALR